MTRLLIMLQDHAPEAPDVLWPLALCLLVSLVSCQQRTSHAEDAGLVSAAGKLMDEAAAIEKFSGAVLLADAGGVRWKQAFGQADRERGHPFTTVTPTYLASVSKQFTSAAILLMQQDGVLCIEDPVTRFLPDLPECMREVRIRHLLQHTSGIPDYYNTMEVGSGISNPQVLENLKSLRSLDFAPGERHTYSNSGYVLLSTIVSAASGMAFSNFVAERLFRPAGMNDSFVLDENSNATLQTAASYDPENARLDYTYRTTGGGGVFSTVEDLYRWDRAFWGGKIVHNELIRDEALLPAVLNDGDTVAYGLGWRMDPEVQGLYYHDGDLLGYRTFYLHDAARNQAVVILNNSSYSDPKGLAYRLYDLLRQE
jgi:CubicO group peptidase (beta-lactamase class C family)